ncbi:MAG TPA: hypothetical protein VMG12_07375 [Polyangiaceae bacterium]|nr:hypothetical protein [Polyangiaceae bacterium]
MTELKRAVTFVISGVALLAACGDDAAPADPGAGAFRVTVSGEDLALLGYDWTSSSEAGGDPPAFVDGWALRFEHVIVTVDRLRINADPDRDEANPLELGPLVAAADGPWAVDVSIGGDVVGKSGSPDERTVPIAAFSRPSNGGAFDAETRYAFSYSLVPAAASARRVNLDAEGLALYEQAQREGWSMILAGTAEYRGPAPEAGSVFAQMPRQVDFTLGLANPSSYVNCRNTDLQAVGDEFPRGIQPNANASTTVQITIHTDHTFWDTLNVEGTPLHFDPIAARASTFGMPDTRGSVTSADLVGADVTALTARDGQPLPWRSVVSDYAAPAGQMAYNANGTSFTAANSLASYLAYSGASGGHMNADGECEVQNDDAP